MVFIGRLWLRVAPEVKQTQRFDGFGRAGAIVAIGSGVTEVSAHLRAARERAGLTIADISASTKIAPSLLLAIERGDFSKLPGDFYTRAFLRTYARELHLSPDSIVDEFESDSRPAQPLPPQHAEQQEVARREPSSQPFLRGPWPQVMAFASHAGVVVALAIVLLVALVVRNRSVDTRPEPGAVGTTGVTAAAQPQATTGTTPAGAPAEKLVIEIQAAAAIWVTGSADGKRVIYRLLAPGERVRVEARDELAFRVGDAAAFTYTVNGVEGKVLGAPGEVRDVQITRDNYRSFRR